MVVNQGIWQKLSASRIYKIGCHDNTNYPIRKALSDCENVGIPLGPVDIYLHNVLCLRQGVFLLIQSANKKWEDKAHDR